MGKVQKEYKIPLEKRLDICFVLNFIKTNKWDLSEESNILFRRRYLLILTHWVKILPKSQFLTQFNLVLNSLSSLGTPTPKSISLSPLEQVLVNEHCCCIHEMLKELNFWLVRADELKKGSQPQIPD